MSDTRPNKKLRAAEFALVIFVALAPLIFHSTFVLLSTRHASAESSFDSLYLGGIITQVSTLMILVYVLFRQGRSLVKIGFTFAWLDLLQSVLLVVIVMVTV